MKDRRDRVIPGRAEEIHMVRRVTMPTAAIVEAGQAIENAIQEYRDVVKLLACDEEAQI
jgi:hypothetical protein